MSKPADTPQDIPRRTVALVMVGIVAALLLFCFTLWNIPQSPKPEDQFDDIAAFICAQDIVEKNLKCPSTAKFCSMQEAAVSHSGEEYTVKGYVDAQNSFGAMIRNSFTATFTSTGTGYKNGRVYFYNSMP